MRIVLLGPPGSGKVELSERIADRFGTPVITVHSVMQTAAAGQSELGRLAKEAMDSARVSDELLLALLRIQLPQMDLSKGFVLVDLPKNAGQADVLDSMLNDLGASVEAVLNLQVDPDELMERLVGRIACDNCGARYNLYINPPMVDGVCDACGARVVRRPDDYEETISNRLRVYEAQMGPLLQYYQLTDKLHRVHADDGIPKAWKIVRKLLEGLPPSEPTGSVVDADKRSAQTAETSAAPAKKKAGAQATKRSKTIATAAKKADAAKTVKSASKVSAAKPKKKAAGAKAASKSSGAKKAVAKKVTKKAAAKKTTKKSTKKVATKKVAAKKVAAKKVAAKKVAAKKKTIAARTVKKRVVKKSTARKVAAKKQVVAKKVAKKKVIAKKRVAKKASAKKAVAKKVGAGTGSAKKTSVRKPAAKKSATRKVAAKKKAVKKKSTPKKAKKQSRRR